MTVTKEDLKVIDTGSLRAGNERHVVQYGERCFIVGATNINLDDDEEVARIMDEDPITGFFTLMGQFPPQDTYVMEAKWSDLDMAWVPKNECSEDCANGVCNKRIASDYDRGDINLGYSLLLDYLNA